MIKSILRKITGRELTEKLKDAITRLHAGEKDVKLPKGYNFYNGKMERIVAEQDYSTLYHYDEQGLLESKESDAGWNWTTVRYDPHGSFTGRKEGARFNTLQRTGIAAGVAGTLAMAMYVYSMIPPTIETRSWQEFKAKSGQYNVEINLLCDGDRCRNITHLTQETSGDMPLAITGHDYNFDGKWDAIFLRRTPNEGYNSVEFRDGQVIFEPCPADKDKGIKRFRPEEIAQARRQLDEVQKYVALENRVTDWNVDVEIK